MSELIWVIYFLFGAGLAASVMRRESLAIGVVCLVAWPFVFGFVIAETWQEENDE